MAHYKAPDQDGRYVSDPGRENPIYRETESLLILSELERAKAEEEEEEDPYRPPDHPSYTDRRQRPPSQVGSSMVAYDDYNTQPQTPLGLQPDDKDDDDSDDDLMFEEDRLAVYEEKPPPDDDDEAAAGPDGEKFHDEEDPEDDGKREWKYSTAGIKQRGVCFKYCCILLLFLIFIAIFMGISMLFNMLFFSDPGPAPPPDYLKRPDNESFPENKDKIDSMCGNQQLGIDRGVRCNEYCQPQYTACCDAFPPTTTYNYSLIHGALNMTKPPTFVPDAGDDILNLRACEFGENVRGCSSYAKCSSMTGVVDPSPGALYYLCSPEQLLVDPANCQAACNKVQCCYNEEGMNCLVENLDVCLDYAPCQNLRTRDNSPGEIVPVAPIDLDKSCLWQLDACPAACAKATCCLDKKSKCFQENFLTCLTYASCADMDPSWNMTLPPIYSFLPQAPAEMIYACGAQEPETVEVEKIVQLDSCPEYCEAAACCYQNNEVDNCFRKDPLGCLAYFQQCQSEMVALANWYTGEYTPPS